MKIYENVGWAAFAGSIALLGAELALLAQADLIQHQTLNYLPREADIWTMLGDLQLNSGDPEMVQKAIDSYRHAEAIHAGGDSMLQIRTGDYEAVIRNMQSTAQVMMYGSIGSAALGLGALTAAKRK